MPIRPYREDDFNALAMPDDLSVTKRYGGIAKALNTSTTAKRYGGIGKAP